MKTGGNDFSKLADSKLIVILREGNHHAYEEIYNRYYYLMFVFAFKKIRNEDQAKDFVQDLFSNLWHKRETIAGDKNLAAYLYTSLRNLILNAITHDKVKQKYIHSFKSYSASANAASSDYLVREKQLQSYIDVQIKSLPAKMRRIFELSRNSHLTYKEIAESLSISEKTVHVQMVNALNRLRTKLGVFLPFILTFLK